MDRPFRVWLVLLAILFPQALASAHHSTSAVFDGSKRITITGTLTKVDWVNPHIAVFVEVNSPAGVQPWKVEASPPAWWRSVGVARADFAKGVGKAVTIEGQPAHDGSRYMYLRKITFADGESLENTSTQ